MASRQGVRPRSTPIGPPKAGRYTGGGAAIPGSTAAAGDAKAAGAANKEPNKEPNKEAKATVSGAMRRKAPRLRTTPHKKNDMGTVSGRNEDASAKAGAGKRHGRHDPCRSTGPLQTDYGREDRKIGGLTPGAGSALA